MNFELLEQSVQYVFLNSKYGNGSKMRVLRNVKEGASASGLAQVGTALADLQADQLGMVTLVQKHAVPLPEEA